MIRKGVKHRLPRKAVVLKTGTAFGGGDNFGSQNLSGGPNLAAESGLPRPLLAANSGPRTTFGRTTFGVTGLDLAIANAATSSRAPVRGRACYGSTTLGFRA